MTMNLSIGLALVLGCALTVGVVLRTPVTLRTSLEIALVTSAISIASLETIGGTVEAHISGDLGGGLTSQGFWVSLGVGAAVALFITIPIDRWMIGRASAGVLGSAPRG